MYDVLNAVPLVEGVYSQYDIVWCDFPKPIGAHPALIVSADNIAFGSDDIMVALCTSVGESLSERYNTSWAEMDIPIRFGNLPTKYIRLQTFHSVRREMLRGVRLGFIPNDPYVGQPTREYIMNCFTAQITGNVPEKPVLTNPNTTYSIVFDLRTPYYNTRHKDGTFKTSLSDAGKKAPVPHDKTIPVLPHSEKSKTVENQSGAKSVTPKRPPMEFEVIIPDPAESHGKVSEMVSFGPSNKTTIGDIISNKQVSTLTRKQIQDMDFSYKNPVSYDLVCSCINSMSIVPVDLSNPIVVRDGYQKRYIIPSIVDGQTLLDLMTLVKTVGYKGVLNQQTYRRRFNNIIDHFVTQRKMSQATVTAIKLMMEKDFANPDASMVK